MLYRLRIDFFSKLDLIEKCIHNNCVVLCYKTWKIGCLFCDNAEWDILTCIYIYVNQNSVKWTDLHIKFNDLRKMDPIDTSTISDFHKNFSKSYETNIKTNKKHKIQIRLSRDHFKNCLCYFSFFNWTYGKKHSCERKNNFYKIPQ